MKKMMDVHQTPLFDTNTARRRLLFKLYAFSIFISNTLIFYYRLSHLQDVAGGGDGHVGRLAWIGLSLSELWFGLYTLLTFVVKWNPVYRRTYKDRLSESYENVLPDIDVFVCTADPDLEPPLMVVNTVLSLMAYNYSPEKLNVYVSDDGCSDITFYALLEAVRFSEEWLPFCREFKVEEGSPEAYFRAAKPPVDDGFEGSSQFVAIKKLYEEMKNRLESSAKLGKIRGETRLEHEGLLEWDRVSNRKDHPSIVKILINGRDPNSKVVDSAGHPLPTLVYLAREKSPKFHHNFKAGAMNALLRVSSTISNAPIILNVDCDMYSNNRDSIRDALCFFMDENNSSKIAFVQYPQKFDNITRNDLYGSALSVIDKLELHGIDSNGGPLYIGTGCFHRREVLTWRKCSEDCNIDCRLGKPLMVEADHVSVVEETCKSLTSCSYEQDTKWGTEMGLMYGCPVEDVITGLAIQCRGWRSIYFNPEREAFVGLAPVTLLQALVQHKRWSEGDFQIFISKYCPLLYGHNKIPLKLQLSYCPYLLWAANCFPTLYYVSVPSLCLLRRTSLFPKISSIWFLPFMYLILATCIYNIGEFIWCGGTFRGFWNDQRMWIFKRTTSYLFGFLDDILKLLGFEKSAFTITAKVADNDVCQRFDQEIMEFGATSPMFTTLTTIAMLNFVCLIGGIVETVKHFEFLEQQAIQMGLCSLLVCINWPVYTGMFFRKDRGSMPSSVTIQSIILASVICSVVYM